MKNLKELKEEKELIASKAILFKIWGNYFKYENNVFFAFAKSDLVTYASGCWFNCGAEEIHRLHETILAGNYEIMTSINRSGKVYKRPSEWMEEK